MPTVFLTGFPGFLGSRLLERLLERHSDTTTFSCLIQARFRSMAEERVAALEEACPSWTGRIRLEEGDITEPDLGLGPRCASLQREAVEIFHLAAVYDLGVPRDVGMRVNVDGTRHMLRFAEDCVSLRRFQYVSTCYVSGRHPGVFTEQDLEKGQVFNNYYEETKYLAEVEVQRRMRAGLPVTIYRPGIVVGDSRTGETQKYDGPYYIMQWILRWQNVVPLPVIGDTRRHHVNLVPSDFVVDAIAYLSSLEVSENTVYQLADPSAPTVEEVLNVIADVTQRRLFRIVLPFALAKASLKHIAPLRRWMAIEPEALNYFVHPTRYTTENTRRDLEGSGIECPTFAEYAERLVAFMERHPDISPVAMV